MNQKVIELLEVLEKNQILLDKVSAAKDIISLYKISIKIVSGYTINDLKFTLEELGIIPKSNLPTIKYEQEQGPFTSFFPSNHNYNLISN